MFSNETMRSAYDLLTEFSPSSVRIITLASGKGSPFGRYPVPQLRFWWGEPHRIAEAHVDSCGKHLLANRCGPYSYFELEEIAQAIVPLIVAQSRSNGEFVETRENGVIVWRRTPGKAESAENSATESPKS